MNEETAGKVPTAVNDSVEKKHPLLGFKPITFDYFDDWLLRWNNTDYLAEKLGLLHYLTMENCWWEDQFLVHLLLVFADGYNEESNFIVRRGFDQDSGAKSRKSIAEKAFAVLCLKFFKGNVRNERPSWCWMLENEVLFKKVLWFLRPNDRGRLHNYRCNMSGTSDHQQETFRVFLTEFAKLGWDWSGFERRMDVRFDESIIKRLVASRPQLIDVLYELDKLDWLNGQELDEPSLKKLKEMALCSELSLPEIDVFRSRSYRKPATLEEAALGGSVAAEVILLHGVKEKERKRIDAIYQASRRKRQEEEQRRQLAELDGRRKKLDQMIASLKR